jgi:hypothetical protein
VTDGSTKSYINDASLGKAISAYVKAERDKAQLTNQDICTKLEEQFGHIQTPDNLKNKINRGNFGAQLLMMIMIVLDIEELGVKEINRLYESAKKGELE